MSLAPFAALESRLNSAVQRLLANATATHQGGEPFGVLLSREGQQPWGGDTVDAAQVTLGMPAAQVADIAEGGELVINGATTYVVTGPVQPDETGWLTVAVYPKA